MDKIRNKAGIGLLTSTFLKLYFTGELTALREYAENRDAFGEL